MSKLCGHLSKAALAAMVLTQISGCAAVGFGLGALVDHGRDDYKTVAPEKLAEVDSGKSISVVRENGASISGDFENVQPLPDSVYQQNIVEAGRDGSIPGLNDVLLITLIDSSKVRGKFSGFSYFSQKTSEKFDSQSIIGTYVPVECRLFGDQESTHPLNHISEMMGANGGQYDSEELRRMALDRSLPINAAVCLANKSGTFHVPFDDISSANVKQSNHFKWIGLAAGIPFDVVIIWAIHDLLN